MRTLPSSIPSPDAPPDVFALDHAATTVLRPTARQAIEAALDMANGNASGSHADARAAKNLLEDARERAAAVLGAEHPMDIVFTAGGTESDNMAVMGVALAGNAHQLVVSAIEHKAVLESAHAIERFGFRVDEVAPDGDGVIEPLALSRYVGPDTALVSVMAANNEVGTIQPIAEIGERVRAVNPDVVVHSDAVQAFVGSDVTVASLGVDLLSLSAHKFGGPKGVGLLYVAPGTPMDPVLHGGGQEAGRRPGTSNVAGVAGMVAAMEEAAAERTRFAAVVGAERDAFEETVTSRFPDAVVTASHRNRLPQFSHIRFPGVPAESLLIRLDQQGTRAAAGSACQSGAIEPSHVLTAMGMSADHAAQCVRFTFGWDSFEGLGRRAGEMVAGVAVNI